MSLESNPQSIRLTDLAEICTQETEFFFQHRTHDTRYCFELFRRAVCEKDQAAWEIIYYQYQALVTGWVKQHRGFEMSGEEEQFFVTGAFAKIASILTTEKFEKFLDLQSLLYYLKMCVHSAITDHNRSVARFNQQVSLDDLQSDIKVTESVPETQVLDSIDNQSLWSMIHGKLHNEKERLVIQGVFVMAFKPNELCDHYKNVFTGVEEVYRIKQNVLARLRRDCEFRRFLGLDD